jgi:hypothetical protein
MSGKDMLVKLSVTIPLDVAAFNVDADEARVIIEEFLEEFLKKTVGADDSSACEPASTTIYRTSSAWAERLDYCLGVLADKRHVHAVTEYGRNMNELWYTVKVFAEPATEDEAGAG